MLRLLLTRENCVHAPTKAPVEAYQYPVNWGRGGAFHVILQKLLKWNLGHNDANL